MRYDVVFILLALICLLFGVALGLWFFGPGDLSLVTSHVHLNLLGWATLALFGLLHRAYPALAAARLAPIHLALAGAGAFLLPLGFALPEELGHTPVLATGGLCAALSPLLFLTMFVGTVVNTRSAA